MGENKCKAVWFNQEAFSLYEQLKKEGLTSQSFREFVKDAFHDKIDNVRMKNKKR